MAVATATGLTQVGRQDRPRRRHIALLAHWRVVTLVLALAALLAVAIVAKRRWIDALAAAAFSAVATAAAMNIHARRVRDSLAEATEEPEEISVLDLGGAARASRSLDEFLNNIAKGMAAMTRASSVSILLRDPVSGRFYCRYRYPTLPAGLNSEPIWLDKNAFTVRRLASLSKPLALDPADFPSWVDALGGDSRMRRRFECDVLTALESRLLVQVVSQDELTGIVSVGPGPITQYDAATKRMIAALASQVSLAIENSYLVKRVAEGERLRREIEMAAEVQRKLLPNEAPNFERLQIATFFQPARDVAGDYFDFFPIDATRIGICVADVAGKGLSAALLMSTVKALLRSHATSDGRGTQDIAAVVASVNRMLCQFTDAPRYTTMFYAEFDAASHELRYVNAGHNPPHVVGRNGSLPLTLGGPVLGLFPDASFEQGAVNVAPGEALVACTDGVLEACNPAGLEFGEHNVLTAARSNTASADTMLNSALRALRSWSDGLPFDDDATLLVARVKEPFAHA